MIILEVFRDLIIPSKKNNYNPVFSTKVAIVILTLWVLLFNSFSGVLLSEFGVHATSMSADRIIQLTNDERARRGLQRVNANAFLTSAAHAKANDMFDKQYWDHFGPDGESPWQFIKASGYSYIYAGENLGKGFTTSEGVHQAWMASPTHKENIISPNYNDIGIAIVNGTLHGEDIILVVQMFGSINTPVPALGVPQVGSSNVPTPSATPTVIQGESEDGRTKSIRIVYPEEGMTYTEPNIPIKGETENVVMGSLVEIVSENRVIGETEVQRDNTWVFENLYDWKEGRNSIDAVVADNTKKYRDSVDFFISSVPPKILGVTVKEDRGNFNVKAEIERTTIQVSLITGDKIIHGEILDEFTEFIISEEEIAGKIFLVISDVHGNVEQKDITKYFPVEDEKGTFSLAGFINLNISSLQRFATILLTTLFLGILMVQIYFYKKAGKLNEKSGDFVMVGIWWFIFLFGSFIGYSGSIY